MKRIKVFLSLLCIGLVATGCKSSVESPVVEDNSTKEDSQTTEVATQENSNYRPEVCCGKEYLFDEAVIDGEYSSPYLTGYYEKVSLSSKTEEAYPALAETFESAMDARNKKYDQIHNDNVDASKQLRKSGEEQTFTIEAEIFLRRADAKVISFVDQFTEYSAGAHGFTSYESYNFDVKSGKELSLEDVVSDKDAFLGELEQNLTANYGADTFDGNLNSTLSNMNLSDYHWAFDYSGITLYFANDIAAYSAGVMTATIPYNSGCLGQDYVPASNEGIISRIPLYFPENEHMDVVDSGDGLTITPNYDPNNPDMFYVESLTISKDGASYTTDTLYVWDVEAYIIHNTDGSDHLMIMTTGDSDYSCDYIFSLDGKIQQVSNDNYSLGKSETTDDYYEVLPSDPANVAFANRFDMLSTFSGTRYYSFVSDGSFNPLENYYNTKISEQQDLISKVELTVPVVDEVGEETGEEVTLPAGTHYSIIRTNGEDEVDCTTSDDRIIRFHLEDPNGFGYIDDIEINGVNAYDLFEMLWYAG